METQQPSLQFEANQRSQMIRRPLIETNPTTIRFKTYPKDEEAITSYTDIIKLNTKGSRIAHRMLLNYEYTLWDEYQINAKEAYRPIEKLKRAKELNIVGFQGISEKGTTLQKASEKLKSPSPTLKIFTAFFPYSNWIALDGMKIFASAFSRMKFLSTVILGFDNCGFLDDECLRVLFKNLKKQRNLRSLSLEFKSCKCITEKSFKYLNAALKSFPFLQEFSLTIFHQTHQNLPFLLAPGIAHIISLNKLTIDFTGSDISDQDDFSSLWASIADLNSLRVLSLDFSKIDIGPTTLENLSICLKALAHLHALSLHFGFCLRRSPFMEFIVQCLQSIPLLNNLTLDLRYCDSIDDGILKDLSICVGTLTKLSEISLDFNGCMNIGDAGVECVTSELVKLANLHSVTLNFVGCKPIKKTHDESLRRNKNIKNLIFYYQICQSSLFT